jgi:multiple sugar transport system permease protein
VGVGADASNFIELLTQNAYMTFFRNSAIVSICVVIITMLISVIAAFLARPNEVLGLGDAGDRRVPDLPDPGHAAVHPAVQDDGMGARHDRIELINNWWTMVILYPTLTVPFCTWIMIGYFASIPKELDEAALIDGATWIQTLTKIFIPVALPGIIAATIFCFTVSWAQFLYPLAFTTSTTELVLPVGIVTTLIKGDVFNWGQIMAGALLGAAPPLIIYAFLMDYYIAGLTAGATKG